MTTTFLRPLLALIALFATVFASAGTLTVTSPSEDGFLGRSNRVAFNVSGAVVQVKVSVIATSVATNSSTILTTTVTPDDKGVANGTIGLDFNENATEGDYTLTVSAEEAGNSYAPTNLDVTVDVTSPLFVQLSPVTNGFTRGAIKVRATLEEANLDSWTVKVGNQIIATGTSNTISADYDASGLNADGVQSVSVSATDKANNTATKTLSLTLDRVKPTVVITFPGKDGKVRGDLNVIVDVTDASPTSVDKTGIDVIVKRTDGVYLARVTLVSLRATSGTTQRWIGRIRNRKGLFPSRYLLTATATDRAGNASGTQQVTLRRG